MNPDDNRPITAKDLTNLVGRVDFADFEIVTFARALDALAIHAAMMDNRDEDHHDGACLECQTMILLGRVVSFGNQLRDAEKRARS